MGIMPEFIAIDPLHGYLFIGSGVALFIPGVFYLYQIWRAFKEDDEEERNTILREIPEM
jgi:hypothetical protein